MTGKENAELSKGIFWIVDRDDPDANRKYCFLIPTDAEGNNISGMELNSKNGSTLNHERVWMELPASLTRNRSFDYYPRGRVEISHGKAAIYLNPAVCTEEMKDFLTRVFGLFSANGIRSVRMIADGSSHYRCHLDGRKPKQTGRLKKSRKG